MKKRHLISGIGGAGGRRGAGRGPKRINGREGAAGVLLRWVTRGAGQPGAAFSSRNKFPRRGHRERGLASAESPQGNAFLFTFVVRLRGRGVDPAVVNTSYPKRARVAEGHRPPFFVGDRQACVSEAERRTPGVSSSRVWDRRPPPSRSVDGAPSVHHLPQNPRLTRPRRAPPRVVCRQSGRYKGRSFLIRRLWVCMYVNAVQPAITTSPSSNPLMWAADLPRRQIAIAALEFASDFQLCNSGHSERQAGAAHRPKRADRRGEWAAIACPTKRPCGLSPKRPIPDHPPRFQIWPPRGLVCWPGRSSLPGENRTWREPAPPISSSRHAAAAAARTPTEARGESVWWPEPSGKFAFGCSSL